MQAEEKQIGLSELQIKFILLQSNHVPSKPKVSDVSYSFTDIACNRIVAFAYEHSMG